MKNVGKVIKKSSSRVTVSSGTVEAFIGRSLERARKLDRGEKLAPEIVMTFEDPVDLARVLSAERGGSYMPFVKSRQQFQNSLQPAGGTGKQ